MHRNFWRTLLIVSALGLSSGMALGQNSSPTVEQMLAPLPTPKGANIAISTPSKAEQAQCKVEFANTPRGGAWLLKDGQGRLLRKFAFTGGSKTPNENSFYRDGFEVYREVISPGKNAADQFLWLGLGGSKIGLDTNGDRLIDTWKSISVEELSQEVVAAVTSKNWAAYQPLLLTEAELAGLGAPAREISRIRELQKSAPARFQQVAAKLANLNASTKWLHLETGAPSRLLAETTGMKTDVLMYYRALILVDTAGKTDSIQLGEIVQVGEAWKLIDAPLTNDPNQTGLFAADTTPVPTKNENPELQKQLEALAELDKSAPAGSSAPTPALAQYHLQRAERIEKIFALVADSEKVGWLKQLVDSLSAAAQASGGTGKAQERLEKLAEHFAKTQPKSDLAAYVAYRAITAEYAGQMAGVANANVAMQHQGKYLQRLEAFVASYPKAEESAEALLQMGMILDFQGKEDDAKKWYTQLAQGFAASKQAAKAMGALRRLNILGQPWEAPAAAVSLAGGPFNPAALRGKTVIVYYWATWSESSAADFAKLAKLLEAGKSKNLALLAINVDDNKAAAEAFVRQHKPVGLHLHAGGGLESQAVQHYGLFVFPNIFLVGSDGKTLAHVIDVPALEMELNPPEKGKK